MRRSLVGSRSYRGMLEKEIYGHNVSEYCQQNKHDGVNTKQVSKQSISQHTKSCNIHPNMYNYYLQCSILVDMMKH